MLTRHGFGFLVGSPLLRRLVPFHWGLFGHARRSAPYTRAEHVRLALEDLGATAIKLGQILSTRGDLLPPEYQVELARLQDAAPPEPVEQIRRTIEGELGHPVDELFARFEDRPLAAASLGQAHAALLPDGTNVVVKVRRHGVVEAVEADLELLAHVVGRVARRWDPSGRYDLTGLAEEFADTLQAELDYQREAANAERFAANFAEDPSIAIPKVFRAYSTSKVLTLERVVGIKIDDVSTLTAQGIDRSTLAQRAADMVLRMIFLHHFFHADPHPGNVFVGPDGQLRLIDFGMVGEVDDRAREGLFRALVAVAARDEAGLAAALLGLDLAYGQVDEAAFARDVSALVVTELSRPLADIAIGRVLSDLLGIARRHHLRLPRNLALFAKTLAMCEGVAATLDPSFRTPVVVAQFLAQAQFTTEMNVDG